MTEDLKNLETQEKRVIRKEQMQIFCAVLTGVISSGKNFNTYETIRKARFMTETICDGNLKNQPRLSD